MGVQIGAKPDSGFDDPIGMLKDCHRRVEHFLQILCVVAERAPGRALTTEEVSAVEAALHYFQVGGRRHTADEEESLFPRLRADAQSAGLENFTELEAEHQEANDLHAAVESLYNSWIVNRRLAAEDEQRLLAATKQLNLLYEDHIEVEEKIVFPRAAKMLDGATIAAIGAEFRARRG